MIGQVTYPAAGLASRSERGASRRVLATAVAWMAYLVFYATTTFVVVGLPVAVLVRLFG